MAMYRNKLVTRKDLADRLNIPRKSIMQVDSKQLFIATTMQGEYLISYYTIVGYRLEHLAAWQLTSKKYSLTTSKHLTQFARGRLVEWVDDELIPDRVE